MQSFDRNRYLNLAKLDDKVRDLLSSEKAASWDTARTEYEISRTHPIYWMEQYGFIKPGSIELGEGGGSDLLPFRLNPVQLQVADKICKHFTGDRFSRVQMIILKHRKAGVSTLIAAFDYWFMRFHDNLSAFIIADLSSHTDNIMEMVRTFQSKDACGMGCEITKFRSPKALPMSKNKKGLRLNNGSMAEQDTGENSNPGTSQTINVAHMSENSKWRDPENAETSLLNSVPRTGFAFVVKESTAFGLNKFAQDCEDAWKGKSAWEFCFITWLDMPDCEDLLYPGENFELTGEEKELMTSYPKMKLGHVKFRRRQIDMLGSAEKFKQDFPLNPREPFLTTGANFFNTTMIQERIDMLKFYSDWKSNGLDAAKSRFPDLWVRLLNNPRGEMAGLSHLEDICAVPQVVELSDNDGNISWSINPEAKLSSGAAIMYRQPLRGRKYLVSVDAAEGKQGSEYTSDNAVIQVFDCFLCEQVMEWAGVFDEEVTAMYAVMIGKIYNQAMIVAETNSTCGGTLRSELLRSNYPYLFYRKSIVNGKEKKEFGWDTKSSQKKDGCSQFRLDFKNGICTIHSVALLEEMLYFIDMQGRLAAADGHLDDRVMATVLNLKVISVTPDLKKREEKVNDFPTFVGESYVSQSDRSIRPSRGETIRRYM